MPQRRRDAGVEVQKQLVQWLRTSHGPDLRVHRDVRLNNGDILDAVTLRPMPPTSGGQPSFRLDLWKLAGGPVGMSAATRLLQTMALARAWYGELVEEAQFAGQSAGHALSLVGNLVGPSVEKHPVLATWAEGLGEILLWTTAGTGVAFAVEPYLPDAEGRRPRNPLRALLPALPWTAAPDETAGRRVDRSPRQELRVPSEISIHWDDGAAFDHGVATLCNLSATGAYINRLSLTYGHLPLGPVRVCLRPRSEHLRGKELHGHIVRVGREKTGGYGIRLSDPSAVPLA